MKKVILLCGMLLAVTASASFAAGLNLRWNNCEGDGGVQSQNFACNSNASNRGLAASFTLDTDMTEVIADEIVIDIQTAGATLAPWWELRGTGCRVLGTTQALTIAAQDCGSCPDMFALAGSMNIAAYFMGGGPADPQEPPPNMARILSVNAVPVNTPVTLSGLDNPGMTWGCARFTINNQKTAGTPNCGRCSDGACIVFNSCNVIRVGNVGNRLLSGPSIPGSDYVTWQGGAGTDCPGAVPTKNATWGTVKSLYR